MNENVYWLLELAVQHGRRDEFTLLMREMVGAALGEPETLNYEWHMTASRFMRQVQMSSLYEISVSHIPGSSGAGHGGVSDHGRVTV